MHSLDINNQNGGSQVFSSASHPVGKPYGSDLSNLPCVSGNCSSNGNYYKYNNNVGDHPESTVNIYKGGKKKTKKRKIKKKSKTYKKHRGKKHHRKKHHGKKHPGKKRHRKKHHKTRHGKKHRARKHKRKTKKMRGGARSSPFQVLTNAVRGIQHSASSAVSTFNGKSSPLSPYPTRDQYSGQNFKLKPFQPSDLNEIVKNADNSAAKL
jgi:hypothetical protein|uniref:Uncharacterized protein n=1 Tax=viral metagenome TaxID=1070528 RepID=A0A6C0JDF3_9ZZZZ